MDWSGPNDSYDWLENLSLIADDGVVAALVADGTTPLDEPLLAEPLLAPAAMPHFQQQQQYYAAVKAPLLQPLALLQQQQQQHQQLQPPQQQQWQPMHDVSTLPLLAPPLPQPRLLQQQPLLQQPASACAAAASAHVAESPPPVLAAPLPLYEGRAVWYPQLAQMRQLQHDSRIDLSRLSQQQMGLVKLTKAHHITQNQTLKSGPPSFRVRICKRCCTRSAHIELGTYVDFEGALLVNDAHELLAGRMSKLQLLSPADEPYLRMLTVLRYHRGKQEHRAVLEVLEEKGAENEVKRQQNLKKRGHDDACSSASDEGGGSPKAMPMAPVSASALVTRPVSCRRILQEDMLEQTFSRMLSCKGVLGLFGALGMADSAESVRSGLYRVLHHAVDPRNAAGGSSDDVLSPDKAAMAASLASLLSAFAPADVCEVGEVVARLEAAHKTADECSGDGVFEVLLEMAEVVEEGRWTECLHVLVSISRYLKCAQCYAWRSLYLIKLPQWSRGAQAGETDGLRETQGLLAGVQRKFTTSVQVLEFLERLKQHQMPPAQELAAAGIVLAQLVAEARGVTVHLGESVAGLCLRLFDLSADSSHLELGLLELERLLPWISKEGSRPERLMSLVYQVALRTAFFARRGVIANGARVNRALERARPHVVALLDAADEMGLLPQPKQHQQQLESAPVQSMASHRYVAAASTAASSSSAAAKAVNAAAGGRQGGEEDLLFLEHKLIVYSVALEYNLLAVSLGRAPLTWRPGVMAADAMADCLVTTERLRHHYGRKPATLLLPDSSRALGAIVEACRYAAAHHPLCAGFAKLLSRSAHDLLRENSQRFFLATLLANSTDSVVEFFDGLTIAGPSVPGPCFEP